MKTYQRINLRRLEAALRVGKRARPAARPAPSPARRPAPRQMVRYDVVPIEDPSYPTSPTEVIDLATGPYRARFPHLADRSGT